MATLQIPDKVQKFLDEVTRIHAPNATIRLKTESWLLKTVAWLIKPFNPTFMDQYITTIGTTIWVPENFFETIDETGALEVISHETQHIIDLKKWGWIIFGGLYLFPQILASLIILSLGAIWGGPLWLFWLLCLGFLAPIPSYGRYRLEMNGYRTAQLFGKYVYQSDINGMNQINEFIMEQLTKQWYYFAWPFTSLIKKRLADQSWLSNARYQELLKWLLANGIAVQPGQPPTVRKKIVN